MERAVLCVSYPALQGREGGGYHLRNPDPESGILKKPKQDLNVIPVNFGGRNGTAFEPHLRNINEQKAWLKQ